jgi:cysteine desulfurase family protein
MTVYFDQAATSYPKPPSVIRAAAEALRVYGGNPGHGGHRMAMQAAEKVYEVRVLAARLFGAEPEQVVFTSNCTHALNLAIQGVMAQGGSILLSMLDHNASLRPAAELGRRQGIRVDHFPVYEGEEERTRQAVRALLRPDTRAVVCTHASNVSGVVLPVREIAALAHENGSLFILDAAQTAGLLPVTLESTGADILCTAGHKGLWGAMGTGLLILRRGIVLPPLMEGGTGIRSLEDRMPEESPERYEAGTLNLPGILSLGAGIREVLRLTPEGIYRREMRLAGRMDAHLREIPGVRLCNAAFLPGKNVPTISFTLGEQDASAVSAFLSDRGFMLRGGYHCAALAHDLLGTRAHGTVRFSCGMNAAPGEVDALVSILKKIAPKG